MQNTFSFPLTLQRMNRLTANDWLISNYFDSIVQHLEKFKPSIDSLFLQLDISGKNQLYEKSFDKKFLTKKNRVKLRNWVQRVCAQSKLSPKIAPLSCHYIDKCYLKGMNIELKVIQEFAVACLWIAFKLHQRTDRPLNLGQYDFNKLVSFEEQIVSKLDFKLNSITYFDISDQLIRLWTTFQSTSMIFQKSQRSHEGNFIMVHVFTNCLYKPFSRLLLFEFLQLAFHFVETLDLDLDKLVFNAFYFILCTQIYGVTAEVNEELLGYYYSADSQLNQIIGIFTYFCQKHEYPLSLQHDVKMQGYLCLIYNSLIQGFNPEMFQRSDITKFDPDHWMWSHKDLYFNQTHFFANKEQSYVNVAKDVSLYYAAMMKQPSQASTRNLSQAGSNSGLARR